ncbi:hypothetical protein E2562_018230 [Oryza meyeriana var. granulata]|uniref:GrpE protein homolog n=1 Tax=Oryza meyeriana var. granulata TaxID=110450 RepID=A0A6G1CGQ5_9ORYZ|nr:hypothetical protein E2562_018230 [Oryza meyeriana var. granulata]
MAAVRLLARLTSGESAEAILNFNLLKQDDKEANKPTEDGVNKSTQSETGTSNETNNSSGTENASQAGSQDSMPQSNRRRRDSEDLDLDLSKEDLTNYAEMENVISRTKRESENAKKYAVQGFSKSLLDVADNLSRASSVVKESFSKIDTSNDSTEAVKLLKTLLEGVEMTEKQLGEVFKKFGVEKFDPLNEKFDPNKHSALFQIPDPSKPSGTVAAVVKVGYMLHDRVLRPAEVGVSEGGPTAEETEENPGKYN